MFHELFRWLQEDLGADPELGEQSWSQELLGSLNLWSVLEGTHVLTLMLFAGTIWIVDLRMMGVAFKGVPFSRLNDKVLPYTAVGFAVMIITGIILFLAKPMDYYHNVWFRAKLIFIIIAAANIFWFHKTVQKNQDEWDSDAKPPSAVRLSGAISLTSWILIIIFGRFIAYNWYECGKPQPGFVNWFAECAATSTGVVSAEEAPAEDAAGTGEGEAPTAADESGTPADDASGSEPPGEPSPPGGGSAPQEPATEGQ